MQVFLDEAIAVLGPLLERVERPDAVLYDIGGFAGRVAAMRWGVPAVQLSPTYVAWEGYERDTAEQTAALKASPSGTRYYATVAIPQAVDQFTNAARLEAIGAGVQLRTEQLDGESLRAAVDAAASRTDRVHQLRADVRSFGGAAIVADTVERLCV